MVKKIFIIVGILLVTTIIGIMSGYNQSVDVRGWWPVIIIVEGVIFFLYAILFTSIDKIRISSREYVTRWHIVIASILALLNILFFTIDIDWLAINNGTYTLTLTEKIIHSDIAHYSILLLSLLVYLITRLFVNKK